MSPGTGAQRRMLAELEQLKERAGMSFAQFQKAVPYSRSALHRYFTGQSPIPRDALVSVVRACDGDVALLVRMWEAAQSDPELGSDSATATATAVAKAPAPPPGPLGLMGPAKPAGPVGPAEPVRPMAVAAGSDGRIRATAPCVQSQNQGQNQSPDPRPETPAEPAGPPERADAATTSESSDPVDPSDSRQRAIRAWFALAFVIVATSGGGPDTDTDTGTGMSTSHGIPSRPDPAPSKAAPIAHTTSSSPSSPRRPGNHPFTVTVVRA
ncbi:hypothetical protein ABH926_007366 [Catenulispora sp. GP43]|uniref:helix-turn-helix domain-containing protein n=1 Tax=Catenulispora sp. GP43 TaxID=3156263 RepID=UPI003513BA99